jgi:hypothetical protein
MTECALCGDNLPNRRQLTGKKWAATNGLPIFVKINFSIISK